MINSFEEQKEFSAYVEGIFSFVVCVPSKVRNLREGGRIEKVGKKYLQDLRELNRAFIDDEKIDKTIETSTYCFVMFDGDPGSFGFI